ncbi:ribosome silencing factor [Aquella oligotrophica]|uniref:Ribosomal silencing factor RsfS n=1 Tax=Aquella oligotrophica TaxID=2067065 RepID=A0A2I7N9N7_9NEIS|nr:ribosome silencing factor [Aquella oligotrophica]
MSIEEIAKIAVNALEDVKGENIVVLDTEELSPLFSRMIVCTGNSNRQVKALANNVTEEFKKNQIEIVGVEGEQGGEWVLVDSGDLVVHIMLPQVRAYYDLESLWNGQRPE